MKSFQSGCVPPLKYKGLDETIFESDFKNTLKTIFQKASLLLLAILLAAPQHFVLAFCTCTGVVFEDVCPCEVEAAKTSTSCPFSNDCSETLDFERDDFVPKQDGFRISMEPIGPAPDFGAANFGFNVKPNLNSSSGFLTDGFGYPPDAVLQTCCVFAKFVNLRV